MLSVCNTSNGKTSDTPGGRKVSWKVLRYFSIIPRLQRLVQVLEHCKRHDLACYWKCTEPGMVFADKSWLEKPRGSQEFYDGVQKFVAHCTPLVNSAGKIRCPCKRCRNILFKPIEWIGDHITDNGWDPLYTVWDKHGEPAPPTPPPQATPTPPPLMSDMTSLLDDLSYIPPNNEHNEPTQEDIVPTRNSGICAPGPDGEMSYGQLQEILEFKYLSFKVALFRVKWFDTRNNGRVKKLTFRNGMTQIIGSGEWWKNDQYILATQVKQVFYLEDPAKPNVKVVEHVNHKKFFNRGVIVVENEPDIIHLDNSSDLPPSTSGNDLDNVTFYIDLHIDGESTEVDAPPDIIDVPGEDDDISDDEDPLPHDLADSDVEDLINDDDGVEKMADVARAHGGDGGGEDPSRPPPTSFGCAGCFINRGKGKRKPNLGGVKAGRKTRERTRNQVLKDAVAANKGRPIEIGFEDRADNTVSTYNLEPHMRSERWPRIEGYIQAQFGKSYNTNKATLKREHWIRDPETGAYDLDRIRRGKPDEYTDDEWEKYINFWNDPANAQRAETNRLNRSKSTVVSRHGSRSIPLTRHLMKMTSATQEEPSEIDTFYRLHTVNGVFQDPEALRMYDRMRELEATGEHTTAEINAMVRGGKLRGHIPGVGPVMPGYVRSRLSYTAPVDRSRDVDFMMSLMRSDNRFADAFARYDSGGASGSGGSRARDREDGDDTGGEDGGDDTS
ncbi:F-box domain containing protein [Tanacetum coccineum]